jgi:hypothetical protein
MLLIFSRKANKNKSRSRFNGSLIGEYLDFIVNTVSQKFSVPWTLIIPFFRLLIQKSTPKAIKAVLGDLRKLQRNYLPRRVKINIASLAENLDYLLMQFYLFLKLGESFGLSCQSSHFSSQFGHPSGIMNSFFTALPKIVFE